MKNKKQVNDNLRTSNRSKNQSWFLLPPTEAVETRKFCILLILGETEPLTEHGKFWILWQGNIFEERNPKNFFGLSLFLGMWFRTMGLHPPDFHCSLVIVPTELYLLVSTVRFQLLIISQSGPPWYFHGKRYTRNHTYLNTSPPAADLIEQWDVEKKHTVDEFRYCVYSWVDDFHLFKPFGLQNMELINTVQAPLNGIRCIIELASVSAHSRAVECMQCCKRSLVTLLRRTLFTNWHWKL